MKRFLRVSIAALVLFFINSCKQQDLTPSWLRIEKFELVTNAAVEGVNTENITDAWVYMDGTFLGTWELPCEFPILDEGEHKFIIYPGIKDNGINATRVKYPFYTRIETTIDLIKDETVTYSPTTYYEEGIVYLGQEDFEDTGTILNPISDSDTSKITIINSTDYPDIVQYGNGCGMVTLDEIDTIIQVYTDLELYLPSNQDIYMEVDFMNNNSFAFGFFYQTSSEYSFDDVYFIAAPQETDEMQWKKVYINLTDYLGSVSDLEWVDYYFVSTLDDGNTDAVIYIDNIKLLYFE